jgi:hypothetical protein
MEPLRNIDRKTRRDRIRNEILGGVQSENLCINYKS